MEESHPTGYSYIDAEIDRIIDKLPIDEQDKFKHLCKQIHSAGFSDGYVFLKQEVKEKGFTIEY